MLNCGCVFQVRYIVGKILLFIYIANNSCQAHFDMVVVCIRDAYLYIEKFIENVFF